MLQHAEAWYCAPCAGLTQFCASQLPAYKAWTFLADNIRATELGHVMFYMDATGEAVPASDSESEDEVCAGRA